MVMRLFLAGDKPKIVSASFFMCAEILHLIEWRPDIGLQIADNSALFNDLFIEHQNSIITKNCKRHNVTDFQGVRNQSVASSKKRDERATFVRSFKSEAKNEEMQPGNEEQRARPASEIAKLSNRFLPGGAQHEYALKLRPEWFVPLMRKYAEVHLEPGVEQAFRCHRVLETQERRMDEREDALNSYLDSKVAAQSAPPRPARTPVDPTLPPKNEFECFLYANTAKVLAAAIKAKVASSLGDATWNPGPTRRKDDQVAALTRAFNCAADPPPAPGRPAAAVLEFKNFCDSRLPPLIYKVPSGEPTARVPKPSKPSMADAIRSAPGEQETVDMLGNLAWDEKRSPFSVKS
jgi:hypothetical protein